MENASPDGLISLDLLIFPDSSGNFSQVLTSLKQSKHSIKNRLASVHKDSLFVKLVQEHYGLPLVANERCGSWYIHPDHKTGSVYFKSTDGHHGQWRFNTRRLNLPLLDVVKAHQGCIVVDSTRRGKVMPDALSKTLPIWIAVMNRFLFPELSECHKLRTPPEAVSASEHAQIETRLEKFMEDLKSLELDGEALRRKITKPMVAVFVTPGAAFTPLPVSQKGNCHPVICCTASAIESTDEDVGYIQGAGDDTEHWAHGLAAEPFWRNEDYLRADCTESELRERIEEVMSAENLRAGGDVVQAVYPRTDNSHCFYLGPLKALEKNHDMSNYDGVVICKDVVGEEQDADDSGSGDTGDERKVEHPTTRTMILKCPGGKTGSRALREQLPRLAPFMAAVSKQNRLPRLLFSCPTGKDLCVGVALTVLCLYYDDDDNFTGHARSTGIDKTYIRQRLIRIQSFLPHANPSRATLQAVNSFLMARPT